MGEKIQETKALGGVQILLQGGHHPYLKLDWYEDMLRHMKSFDIHVHGFSPSEIQHFATVNKMSVHDVLVKLRAAGLDSIPAAAARSWSTASARRSAPSRSRATSGSRSWRRPTRSG
jgi:cyclic dehypoxanthinyl futalosine synthase